MTNEYKENLINYFTGNIEEETGTNAPYFIDTKVVNNQLDTYLTDELGSYAILGFIKGVNSDNTFIYGTYSSQTKGFILTLDKSQNILNLYTKYNTGTDFGAFRVLNIDENGYVYGIDYYNSNYRFILLNNLLSSNQVVLRQSYIMNDYALIDYTQNSLKKVIGEATYFMLAKYTDGEGNYEIRLVQLKINVGSANEWNIYSISAGRFEMLSGYDYIVSKNNDTYNTECYYSGESSTTTPIYKLNFDGTNLTKTIIISSPDPVGNVIVISSNKFYYTTVDTSSSETTSKIIEYNNGSSTTIATKTSTNNNSYSINKINNILIAQNIEVDYSTNPHKTTICIGIYYNNYYVEEEITQIQDNNPILNVFYATNIFNLYKIIMQVNDNFYVTSTILSDLYSGYPFTDENSLNQYSGVLYNENNEIIFARNLYDKTIINNTTEANLEVPNNYLNEDIIQTQNLISKNNNNLVSNSNPITKNIYESLYINFFNTINIIDKNNSNSINNIVGASRLNNSVSNIVDYTDTQINKVRINYSDNTNSIRNITWSIIDETHQSVQFNINVSKQISSIDFISNDESTIYLTIQPTLELGKTYTITQYLRVE